MSGQFEYTTLAQRYTARFPVLTYVGTQINFWIVANVLLAAIIFLIAQIFGLTFNLPVVIRFGPVLLIAGILGLMYGVCLGVAGYYLDRGFFKRLPLVKVVVLKTTGSLLLLATLLYLLRMSLYDVPFLQSQYLMDFLGEVESWNYLFSLMLMYYLFMTLVISFINQVNKKYGPGVLIPLLLGKYRDPKEEERVFMFMDLKSSTKTAEALGHLKYSAFIRDCFMDINEMLFPHYAQVYQYAGDEIIVTWPGSEGIKDHACIRFFFACKKQFQDKANYYLSNYGFLPEFKAGVHMGIVTAVEIGEIKKDIAYHGDTLNTASRIQSVCNEFNKDFLASESLLARVGGKYQMKAESLGMIQLRGKTEKVGIASVEWNPTLSGV